MMEKTALPGVVFLPGVQNVMCGSLARLPGYITNRMRAGFPNFDSGVGPM